MSNKLDDILAIIDSEKKQAIKKLKEELTDAGELIKADRILRLMTIELTEKITKELN